MEQKIINYLTTIILSILFPLARWVPIEMHSNSPPQFPIVTGEWRPLYAHPDKTIKQQSAYYDIKFHNSRHKGIYNNEKTIEGTGAIYKTRNINLQTIIKHNNLIMPLKCIPIAHQNLQLSWATAKRTP